MLLEAVFIDPRFPLSLCAFGDMRPFDDMFETGSIQDRRQGFDIGTGWMVIIVGTDARCQMDIYVFLRNFHDPEAAHKVGDFYIQPVSAAAAAGKCHIPRIFRIFFKRKIPFIKIFHAPKTGTAALRQFTLNNNNQFCHSDHLFVQTYRNVKNLRTYKEFYTKPEGLVKSKFMCKFL